jgi:hypothetical protein
VEAGQLVQLVAPAALYFPALHRFCSEEEEDNRTAPLLQSAIHAGVRIAVEVT